MDEADRIQNVYQQRHDQPEFFVYENPAHLCRIQERYRATLLMLKKYGYHPLSELRILDIGCGNGVLLRQFIQWGAKAENLAGIEIRPQTAERAAKLTPDVAIRTGSAGELPWSDSSFDLVCQHTVFTSVLDSSLKQQIAGEMQRILAPKGAILWYDFRYDNPKNPNVKGVTAKEIKTLFPGFELHLRRMTLVPFIARRIPEKLQPMFYPMLSAITLLRTHYLGLFIR